VAPLASPPPTSTPEPAVIPDRPSATALFERALTAQQTGNIRQAIRLFKRATQADPTMKSAYSNLGNLYYQQQRYQEALETYQQALALDPDDVKTRNNLGSTYIQLAMDEDAIKELQQALRLDESYSLAYYNLACVHARAGQSTEAVQYLQQAIVLTPEARQWAQTDADFAPVRSHPDVRRLLEP
jgi:tetratricopeptide (TPR) repeat protein